MSIRIYYFELPINKRITYNNTTKISDLIKNAINAYLEDKTLDASKIKEREFESNNILTKTIKLDFQKIKKDSTLIYQSLPFLMSVL